MIRERLNVGEQGCEGKKQAGFIGSSRFREKQFLCSQLLYYY